MSLTTPKTRRGKTPPEPEVELGFRARCEKCGYPVGVVQVGPRYLLEAHTSIWARDRVRRPCNGSGVALDALAMVSVEREERRALVMVEGSVEGAKTRVAQAEEQLARAQKELGEKEAQRATLARRAEIIAGVVKALAPTKEEGSP